MIAAVGHLIAFLSSALPLPPKYHVILRQDEVTLNSVICQLRAIFVIFITAELGHSDRNPWS